MNLHKIHKPVRIKKDWRRGINYPMIQMIAPTKERTRATRANGNPNKKPRGLHSPILCLPDLKFFRGFADKY